MIQSVVIMIMVMLLLLMVTRTECLLEDGSSSCDFTLEVNMEEDFAAPPRKFRCRVSTITGPRKDYPDLWTMLSNQRPMYDCWNFDTYEEDTTEFTLLHYRDCWRLEYTHSREEIICLRSWAVNPLLITTSSPKLTQFVNTERCPTINNSFTTFHLTDYQKI